MLAVVLPHGVNCKSDLIPVTHSRAAIPRRPRVLQRLVNVCVCNYYCVADAEIIILEIIASLHAPHQHDYSNEHSNCTSNKNCNHVGRLIGGGIAAKLKTVDTGVEGAERNSALPADCASDAAHATHVKCTPQGEDHEWYRRSIMLTDWLLNTWRHSVPTRYKTNARCFFMRVQTHTQSSQCLGSF